VPVGVGAKGEVPDKAKVGSPIKPKVPLEYYKENDNEHNKRGLKMKSLVVYSSQTGNTRKLAEAIFDALSGGKDLYPVNEVPDPSIYSFIAVGFWLKGGKPDPKSSEYLGKIGKKPLFLFATHGAGAGSDHAIKGMEVAKSLAPESDIRAPLAARVQ
jgi:hypothetical protein